MRVVPRAWHVLLAIAFLWTTGCRHTLDAVIDPAFSNGHSGGVVLIARGDRVLFRRAYGMADRELGVPMRPDHVLATGSITKQFTAVAILQLVAQRMVALEDDVRKYVPELPTGGRTITIEQLLTHTSGLPNVIDREDFESLSRRDFSLRELLALTRDMPVHFEPGQGYRYSDSGYFALGAVIERVSGTTYRDYIENRLFRPLGMNDTWYGDDTRIIPRRARGYSLHDGRVVRASYISMTVPHAAGAVFSTADDLFRWDRALRSGMVIPAELLKRAWSPRTLPDGTHSGYGFGWQLCTLAGRPTIEHGGFVNGFQANLLRLPSDDLTIVVLLNNDGDAPNPGVVARRAARFLSSGSPDPRFHELTPDQRAALVGTYRVAPGNALEIVDRGGVLHMRRNEGAFRPLSALSPTELTLLNTDGEFILHFDLGDDARATRVRSSLRCEPVDAAPRIDVATIR